MNLPGRYEEGSDEQATIRSFGGDIFIFDGREFAGDARWGFRDKLQ
jgi:hypothetical protein